jgi:hypothetical protein
LIKESDKSITDKSNTDKSITDNKKEKGNEEVEWEDIDVTKFKNSQMPFQALPESCNTEQLRKISNKKISSGSLENLNNSTMLNTGCNMQRRSRFGDNLITTIDKERLFNDEMIHTETKLNNKHSNNTLSSAGLNTSNVNENVFVLECYESPIKKNSNGEKFIQRNSFFNNENLLSKYQQYYNMNTKENIVNTTENNTNDSSFLENPSYIIAKNLINKGWFLLSDHNNILGNFNSVELLRFLENELRMNKNLNNLWITDYETDIYFTPKNLYDLLRDLVPNLIEMKKINNPILSKNLTDYNLTNTNMSNNKKQADNSFTNMLNPKVETRRKIQIPVIKLPSPKTYSSKQYNHMSSPVNINLQYVNNNYSLSHVMYNQKYPKIDVSKILRNEHKL